MKMTVDISGTSGSHGVVFIPSVYNDAISLLNDAQEYFSGFGATDQERLEPHLRSIYSCEMARITLRLSSVMSWLLAQRAIADGKINSDDSAHYNLSFQEICRVDNSVLHGILPSYVCYLLDESFALYERVLRLDVQTQTVH